MNQHVSPDSAIKLRAAGFPQPAPEYGQRWYYVDDDVDVTIEVNTMPIQRGEYFPQITNNHVFAPTAIDILRELGSSFSMFFREEDKVFEPERESVFIVTCDSLFVKPNIHENPAEAAALAWFEANGK